MLSAVVSDDGIPKRRSSGLAGAAVSNVGSRRENATTTSSETNPQISNRPMLPPARVTVGKNVGLHVTWYVYRGKGKVTFSPDQVMSWEDTRAGANSPWAPVWAPPEMPADGKAWVTVTFHEPGTYVIRSHADDGALMADGQVTIVVNP
jgi:plastocyanin